MPWDRFPTRTVLFVLFVAVLAFVLFGVRFPAKAQEQLEQAASQVAENISRMTGLDSRIIEVRGLEDLDYAISALSRPDNSFVVSVGETFRVISLQDLLTGKYQSDVGQLLETYQQQLISRVRLEDSRSSLVVFSIGEATGAMVFPVLSREPYGPLFDFTREFRPPPLEETKVLDRCSPPLTATLNILRRPAESLQICMTSVCRSGFMESCTFNATVVERGLFTRFLVSPESRVEGTLSGGNCSGLATFQVSYLVANISLLVFETEFGLEVGGRFRSELDCGGVQTITRM